MSDEWEFPWPKPSGFYDSDGPSVAAVVHLPGADYSVSPTGDIGSDTGRSRFCVECLTCSEVLHASTTGTSNRIRRHQRERHGGTKT